MYCTKYASPIGPLTLTSDGQNLTGLWLETQGPPTGLKERALPVFDAAARWLDAYFRGEPLPIDVLPLSPAGTDFQNRVWDILAEIPYGKVRTYGEIARMLGDRMSAQAVGGAVGRNPISIIIPCHRVIGAEGKLTGYAGGLEYKKWLLAHEEAIK